MAYADVILGTANLAAYWRLGEPSGANVLDIGPNGLDLTYTGSPTLGVAGLLAGDSDTCVDFNGSTQYAIRTTHAQLQGGSALTVECWVNSDTFGNKAAVGFFGSSTDKGYWINLQATPQFLVSNNGSAQFSVQSSVTMTAGLTYHIVGTYDGETILIYVNGVQVGTDAGPTGALRTVVTANSFAIGRLGALSSDYADGRIDDVAIYNRVLTSTEILAHYTAGITSPYLPGYIATAPSEVTIGNPGWSDMRIVPISPPTMAWRTDGPGSFTCLIETRKLATYDLQVQGILDPLKGRWLWWEHPTAGAWSGVITRTEVGSWFTRVTAEQYNVLLRKRRLSANYGPMSISPGSLALTFLNSAERNGDSFLLTGWTAEESGQAIDIEPRGGDLCDEVIPQLARFGYQWRVKATTMNERAFEFRTRLGQDKRRTVMLSEGRTIAGFRMGGDLWTVANSIIGIPADAPWRDSKGYQLDNEQSMRELGRRYEAVIAYSGVATRSTIAPLVKRDLDRMRYPREIAEVQVVDEDMCFRDFREGDIITVQSQHANLQIPMDVDIRALNAATGVLTIAGRLYTEDAA